MVGANYELVNRKWLFDRGRRIRCEKSERRHPYFRKEISIDRWQERRAAAILSGLTLKNNPLPSGVEVSFLARNRIEICVCLPEGGMNREFHLSNWGLLADGIGHFDRAIMGDVFVLSGENSRLLGVCVLDYLDRLLNLKCWDGIVGLHLRNFPKPQPFYAVVDSRINGGCWDFQYQVGLSLKKPGAADIDRYLSKSKFGAKDTEKAKLAAIRHGYTPYDYLWQTCRTSIGSAQEWAQWAIEALEEANHA